MTLQAIEPVRVSIPPQDWPEPEMPSRCQLCPSMLGLQWHHIVRRSETAGPKDWISIDGLVVWNKLRVCIHCHERINAHDIWIRYWEGTWTVWRRQKFSTSVIPTGSAAAWIKHPKSGEWFLRIGPVAT